MLGKPAAGPQGHRPAAAGDRRLRRRGRARRDRPLFRLLHERQHHAARPDARLSRLCRRADADRAGRAVRRRRDARHAARRGERARARRARCCSSRRRCSRSACAGLRLAAADARRDPAARGDGARQHRHAARRRRQRPAPPMRPARWSSSASRWPGSGATAEPRDVLRYAAMWLALLVGGMLGAIGQLRWGAEVLLVAGRGAGRCSGSSI